MSYADGSGGPTALRTSPLASELPLTCEALPFAGGPSGPYLSGCARQPFIVRCAHYARGASLSTFGFVTIVPRYLLPQVIPSHSFAALTALIVRRIKGGIALLIRVNGHLAYYNCINGFADQSMPASASRHTPPEGALAYAPGGGALPPGGHVKANTDSLSISFSGSTMDSTFSPAICRSSAEAAARPISRRGTSTVVSRGTH